MVHKAGYEPEFEAQWRRMDLWPRDDGLFREFLSRPTRVQDDPQLNSFNVGDPDMHGLH